MKKSKFFTSVSILAFLTLFSPSLSLAMKESDEKNKKIHSKKSTPKKSKKSTSSIFKEDSVEDLTDLLGVMNTNDSSNATDIPENKITITNHSPSVPVTLGRYNIDGPIAHYAQNLLFGGHKLKLNRSSTRGNIEYVRVASLNDGNKTHLLVQGVCKTEKSTWAEPFKTSIGFPQIVCDSDIPIDWVSFKSNAATNTNRYIRKPLATQRGGHSEPRFISDFDAKFINDFDAKFVQNSDGLVPLFMPEMTDDSNVYMCGLELFGPYDMCDAYNGGTNQYNCVGQLKAFRIEHQQGQNSISQAIRDRLGDRFKGSAEDAFVVIYHAKYSYENIDTYYAINNNNEKSAIDYDFAGHEFNIGEDTNSNDFDIDDSHVLSQRTEINTAPSNLYGYIHHIGDQSVRYDGSFKF